MRKTASVLCLAAVAALALSASAGAARYRHRVRAAPPPRVVDTTVPAGVTGATAGTVAAVGTYNVWWGTGAFASTLPATAVGSAAVGGVAGIGSVALIDAALQPCRGFAALFDLSHGECVNGEYVGYAPPSVDYR